jgi:hypothetical protein
MDNELLTTNYLEMNGNIFRGCQTLHKFSSTNSGLQNGIIYDIFQATVVAKLSYASPAWWEYASAADRARLEAFLQHSIRLGLQSASTPTLARVCVPWLTIVFLQRLSVTLRIYCALSFLLHELNITIFESVLIASNFPSGPLRLVTAVSLR